MYVRTYTHVYTYVRSCSPHVSLSVFASHPLCLRARRRPHRHRPGVFAFRRRRSCASARNSTLPGEERARATRCDSWPGSSEHSAALARLIRATSHPRSACTSCIRQVRPPPGSCHKQASAHRCSTNHSTRLARNPRILAAAISLAGTSPQRSRCRQACACTL